jgi:hypothetical protein
MPKCKFRYSDSTQCDQEVGIKSVDTTKTIIQRYDEDNKPVLRAWHPIKEYNQLCMYHQKLVTGMTSPVITLFYNKTDLIKMSDARIACEKVYRRNR